MPSTLQILLPFLTVRDYVKVITGFCKYIKLTNAFTSSSSVHVHTITLIDKRPAADSISLRLQMVAAALLGAFRASTSVVMIGAVIFLVFATLGVQIFGGAFSMCTDLEVQLRDDCVGVDAYNKTRE